MSESYVDSLLADHEKILLITHQHIFILLSTMAWEIILTVVFLIGVTAVWLISGIQMAVFGYFLLLIPLVGSIADILVWHNREFIITNRRVIQVSGLFSKDVIDSSLEKVNDVKMDQSFLGRIFNYGDVEILTASELGTNLFRKISDPIHFKTAMLNAKEGMARGNDEDTVYPGAPAAREVDPHEIPDMISRLDQLRRQGAISEAEFQQKKADLLRHLD